VTRAAVENGDVVVGIEEGGGVFGFFPWPRPRPPHAGELKPGGVQVVVAAAYDCCVGVDGLSVLSSGDGVRSRTCDRWSMILEVTVSGLRKEVVWPALKMAVRWRSPWPEKKLQKKGNAFVEAKCDLRDVPVLL
jgi:hypothetical protein